MTRTEPVHVDCIEADDRRYPVERGDDWRTLYTTAPSGEHVPNVGSGLIGYLWEENGPALAARSGAQSLAAAVADMVRLPYADVLYIRCDWRDVQCAPGRLELGEVWELAEEAAAQSGRRIAFRVQSSNPDRPDGAVALPEFLLDRVPMRKIGCLERRGALSDVYEPAYDDPAYRAAFIELNDLLSERFDGHASVEFVDLMMYGFWGEGHTANLRHPFESDAVAERTLLDLAVVQSDRWRKTPLVVNLQPDISSVGNARVQDLIRESGGWVRTDSVIVEEPQQIWDIAHRPAAAAAILEDGAYRRYEISPGGDDSVQRGGRHPMLDTIAHALDAGPNYWSLWTESRNVAGFFEAYPEAYRQLVTRLGYRVRPSWVWQRRTDGDDELVVGIVNSGAAGPPGRLHVALVDEASRGVACAVLPPGAPQHGAVHHVRFRLPASLVGGRVGLTAWIETRPEMIRPVNWCTAESPGAGGLLWFSTATLDQPGWRGGL